MKRSELNIQIFLTNGKSFCVVSGARKVMDDLLNGKDQFIEMQCTDGCHHYMNVDRIIDVKEIKEVPYDRMR